MILLLCCYEMELIIFHSSKRGGDYGDVADHGPVGMNDEHMHDVPDIEKPRRDAPRRFTILCMHATA